MGNRRDYLIPALFSDFISCWGDGSMGTGAWGWEHGDGSNFPLSLSKKSVNFEMLGRDHMDRNNGDIGIGAWGLEHGDGSVGTGSW